MRALGLQLFLCIWQVGPGIPSIVVRRVGTANDWNQINRSTTNRVIEAPEIIHVFAQNASEVPVNHLLRAALIGIPWDCSASDFRAGLDDMSAHPASSQSEPDEVPASLAPMTGAR